MILISMLVFLAVRQYGEAHLQGLSSVSTTTSHRAEDPQKANHLYHVLLAMAAVIVAGRLLGVAFRMIGQPKVIGEIVGGIMLGPSFLGWLSPPAHGYLLPAEIAPSLHLIAQFGVILYMFLVGLEFNTGLLRERGDAMVAISHASIVFPFLLGSCLALGLDVRGQRRQRFRGELRAGLLGVRLHLVDRNPPEDA